MSKRVIIIAIITVILLTVLVFVLSQHKSSKIKKQKEQLADYQRQLANPEVSTVTNPDGTIIPKDQAESREQLASQLRLDSRYKSFYGSSECSKKANLIKDAWGLVWDSPQDVFTALSGLNKFTLLALQDYMCNTMDICSIHNYLKEFLSDSDYNKAVESMNNARKIG